MFSVVCSAFLPQDKVHMFATMSPQTILKETQKAAGNPKMTEWHESLINLSKEQRELEAVSLIPLLPFSLFNHPSEFG